VPLARSSSPGITTNIITAHRPADPGDAALRHGRRGHRTETTGSRPKPTPATPNASSAPDPSTRPQPTRSGSTRQHQYQHPRQKKFDTKTLTTPVLKLVDTLRYCKDSNRTAVYPHVYFTFLGFTFRPRKGRQQSEPGIHQFLAGVSADALKRMRKEVRGWRNIRQTTATPAALAKQYNPVLRGWRNYFGEFYPSRCTASPYISMAS